MIDQVQEVIDNTEQYYKKYGKIYTTCYWSQVRMSNCRDVFKVADIKAIRQLGEFAENLMISSQQIMKMAQEVQADLKKLQCTEDVKLYYARSCMIKEKFEMVAVGNKYISEKQAEFVRCTMIVKKLIEQSSKPTRREKMKTYFWKKRNHPKTTG